jgi:hypothetical protein
MTQETQVTLTLEAHVTQSKADIRNFIMELIRTHISNSSTYNRMMFDFKLDFDIKEESEIYETD